MADAVGEADGEAMDFRRYLDITRTIVGTVDVEPGYGLPAAELLTQVAGTGAAGMNIEDTRHGGGGRICSRDGHAEYTAGVRRAADAAGLALVINGRTGAVKHGTPDFEDPEAEAVERMKLMVGAGSEQPGDLTALTQLGVRCITWRPKWRNQVAELARESLAGWVG